MSNFVQHNTSEIKGLNQVDRRPDFFNDAPGYMCIEITDIDITRNPEDNPSISELINKSIEFY